MATDLSVFMEALQQQPDTLGSKACAVSATIFLLSQTYFFCPRTIGEKLAYTYLFTYLHSEQGTSLYQNSFTTYIVKLYPFLGYKLSGFQFPHL